MNVTFKRRHGVEPCYRFGNARAYHSKSGSVCVEYVAHSINGSNRVRLRFPTIDEAKTHMHEFAEAQKPNSKKERLNKLKEEERIDLCNGTIATKLQDVRRRCKKKGWTYGLSRGWLMTQLQNQDYKCLLTGRKFQHYSEEFKRNPWCMSIDRIDSKLGYIESNCRVVCYAVNAAMNEWGESVFAEIANKYITHQSTRQRITTQ